MFARIKKYLEKREARKKKEIFMKKRGFDLKCSHCDTWLSQSSNPENYECRHTYLYEDKNQPDKNTGDLHRFTCPDCNEYFYFRFDIAPVALSCDEHGFPDCAKKKETT